MAGRQPGLGVRFPALPLGACLKEHDILRLRDLCSHGKACHSAALFLRGEQPVLLQVQGGIDRVDLPAVARIFGKVFR